MYSEYQDLKARLPFTVDDNSIPSNSDLISLQEQANMFINGWLTREEDVAGNPKTLRLVEIITTINWALSWHDGRDIYLGLSKDAKIMLDNYKRDKTVYRGDFKIE